jgi:hypothetical protein
VTDYFAERYKPSVHPRLLPKNLMIQVPYFMASGLLFAGFRSLSNISSIFIDLFTLLARFWGWTENEREVQRWQAEGRAFGDVKPAVWEDNDW